MNELSFARPASPVDQDALIRIAGSMGVTASLLNVGQRAVMVWEKSSTDTSFPPLILLHGASYSSQSVFNLPYYDLNGSPYSLMLGLHQHDITSFAFDMSGYGASSMWIADTRLDHFVRELDAVVEMVTKRGHGRPIVVGWSWGGEVAGRFAERFQAKIAGLVLWGAPWCGGQSDLRLGSVATGRFAEDRRINTKEHSLGDFRTEAFYESDVPRAFSDYALWVDKTAPNTCMRALKNEMPLFRPERIMLPVLLFYGAGDPVFKSSDPDCLLECLGSQRKTRIVVPQSDHNTQFCKSRHELWEALRAFAKDVEAHNHE